MGAHTDRGEQARQRIISAARAELLKSGPERLSLRAVARSAGYAPSALYNHFRDRDELVIALAMSSVSTLAGYLQAVPSGPAPERLKQLARAYVRFAEENPEQYRVIFDCLANPPHTWSEYTQVAHPFSLIIDGCRLGLEEGSIQDPSGVGAAGLAYGMWALVDGHVHLRARHLRDVTGPYPDMLAAALGALLGEGLHESTGGKR